MSDDNQIQDGQPQDTQTQEDQPRTLMEAKAAAYVVPTDFLEGPKQDATEELTLLPHQKEMMQSLLEKGTVTLALDAGAGSSTYVEVDPKASSGSLADGIPGTSSMHVRLNHQVQKHAAGLLYPGATTETTFAPSQIQKDTVQAKMLSGEAVELRITEDSTGKCIRVAYYAGDSIRKIVWEPARTWSRN